MLGIGLRFTWRRCGIGVWGVGAGLEYDQHASRTMHFVGSKIPGKKGGRPDAVGLSSAAPLGEGHEAFVGVVIHARTGDDVIIASDDDIIPEREKTLIGR